MLAAISILDSCYRNVCVLPLVFFMVELVMPLWSAHNAPVVSSHTEEREKTMHATRTELIATLEQTGPALVQRTSQLTDAELDFRTDAQEWSIREILAHLVDDEMFVMRTRLERMIKEEHPSLASHDEQKWYHQRNTTRDSLNELLSDFTTQRAASLGILTLLRDQEWARTAYHPEYENFTAEEWVGNWVEHDLTHLRQIEQTLADYAKTQGQA